ncbi:hypothetical protein MPH_11468 [Macrophomina phaseolina MS6]|uniref:Uncharacterized protein n=1 Tax=Macrophomina phaseolina (strain MS6) TaxID=1126212 RepID=K2RAE4_MACPH|nr:hypothetical protein MPH_11468 [Macrophomina phaseolina MS6]
MEGIQFRLLPPGARASVLMKRCRKKAQVPARWNLFPLFLFLPSLLRTRDMSRTRKQKGPGSASTAPLPLLNLLQSTGSCSEEKKLLRRFFYLFFPARSPDLSHASKRGSCLHTFRRPLHKPNARPQLLAAASAAVAAD